MDGTGSVACIPPMTTRGLRVTERVQVQWFQVQLMGSESEFHGNPVGMGKSQSWEWEWKARAAVPTAMWASVGGLAAAPCGVQWQGPIGVTGQSP